MNLYELTGSAMELMIMLENGEIDEEVYKDTLENLDIETKIENICRVLKNLESEALAFKTEKDRLAERQKTTENAIKRLKDSLLDFMIMTNQSKVKSGLFSVSIGNSEKVIVTDQDKIPAEYRIKQEDKIDIAGLKKAIKESGEEFEGVTLEKCQHVRIR